MNSIQKKPSQHISDFEQLASDIKKWGQVLGFQQLGICDVELSEHEPLLQTWLNNGMHGEMEYMERHGMMRCRPSELVPNTIRVICARMDYLPADAKFSQILADDKKAFISRYALGRDYHKLLRKKLQLLATQIADRVGEFGYRVFVDSAPVLERPLATKAGLGFTGKHTLLINKQAGSWFFLGEIFTDLPLPTDGAIDEGCGECSACIHICPTQPIVAPYVIDARRCISYLTIELKGSIPEEFRSLLGNRIYGCDDCQLTCPWNRFASLSLEDDFKPRNDFADIELLELFQWTESGFLRRTEGSPIRRIGYESWQRNIAVALGNATYAETIVAALHKKLHQASELVSEHIHWAIAEQKAKKTKQPQKLIQVIQKMLPRDA